MGRPSRRRSRTEIAVILVVGVLYAWVASPSRPFTVASNLAVFVPAALLALCVVAQSRSARLLPALVRRRPDPQDGGLALVRRAWPWFAVGFAIVVVELVELPERPRAVHPTVSSLIDPTLVHQPARFVYFVAWLAFGVFLVRR